MGRTWNRQVKDREFQLVGERARGVPKSPGRGAEERGDGVEGSGRKGAEEEHCINSCWARKRKEAREEDPWAERLAGSSQPQRTGAPGLNLGGTFGGLKRASSTAW
jgi:hypothetical protein